MRTAPAPRSDVVRWALQMVVLGVAYFVAARLSLHLSLVGKSVTPLWPPTGIALVGLLVFGYRVWPAIWVAAFAVNAPISSPAAAVGIAVGNTLAPVVATTLLKLTGFRPDLDRTRDAAGLVVVGALWGMTVSATIGTLSLIRWGSAMAEGFWQTWAVWWAGDAMGILAVAPFLLGVRSLRFTRPIGWWRIAEALGLLGLVGLAASLLAVTSHPVWVIVFPLLVLMAGRFQQRGAGPAALLVIATASWSAAHNGGPFAGSGLLEKMVALQAFNAAVALTSFFFAAVVAERIAVRRELDRSAREMYQREHRIAETLQRSLLPERMPSFPDVAVSAKYVPATAGVEVGGDWYDIIPISNGRLGLVIGDVAGHGIVAAAAMGQIRMALRAYVLEDLSPAKALGRLNGLIAELQPGTMATLIYGHLDPETGSLTLAKSGHPPPLIINSDGTTSFVLGGLSPPLGVSSLISFTETMIELPPGATLFLYTDGLIERRGESIDRGLERLARVAAEAPPALDDATEYIVSCLIAEGAPSDDTAVLAVRRVAVRGAPLKLQMPAVPGRLTPMRQMVGRWLRLNGAGDEDVADIVVACTEACANVIQHAYGSREGLIDLEATIVDATIVFTVRDFGKWRSNRGGGDDRGRGLDLMKGLMNRVEVTTTPEGTVVLMTRKLESLVTNA